MSVDYKKRYSRIIYEILKDHYKNGKTVHEFFNDLSNTEKGNLLELVLFISEKLISWKDVSPEYKCSLNLKRTDYGIDALSRNYLNENEEKSTVQIKYRNDNYVSFRELSTFYSLSNIWFEKFKKVLITNKKCKLSDLCCCFPFERYEISEDVILNFLHERYLKEKDKILNIIDIPFSEEILNKLEENNEENNKENNEENNEIYDEENDEITESSENSEINSVSNCSTIIFNNIKGLRDYQNNAIRYCINSNKKRNYLNIPCGCGKSLIISNLVYSFSGNSKILILVPSLLLLEQMYNIFSRDERILPIKVGTGYNNNINLNERVYISVYNSVNYLKDIDFDYVIIDEGHHLTNETYNNESYMSLIKNLNAEKFFYFSGSFDPEIVDIDFNYTIEHAINNNYLVDYDITIPLINGNVKNGLIQFLKQRYDLRRVIAYCNRIESSKEFSKMLNENGISSCHVDSSLNVKERYEIIQKFERGEYRVLCNVNILNEGINIPIADTCMFVNIRNSKTNIIQCIGRILRKHEKKAIGHVIFPNGNCLNDDSDELFSFFKTISSFDQRVKKSLNDKNIGRINFEHLKGNEDEENDEYELVEVKTFERIYISQIRDYCWIIKYEKVKKYFDENEKYPSEKDKDSEIRSLGMWRNDQRKAFRKNKLSPERLEKLNELSNFFESNDDKWNENYEKVKNYFNKNGKYPYLSKKDKDSKIKSLGRWCNMQRKAFKKNKLLSERLEKLNELSNFFESNDDKWNEIYEEVKNYFDENKNYPSRHDEDSEIKSLGRWRNTQKVLFNKNKLSSERIEKLNELSNFFESNDDKWNENYEEVKNYFDENKKYPSTIDKDSEIKSLGRWCNMQRVTFKKNKLSSERLEKLNELSNFFNSQRNS